MTEEKKLAKDLDPTQQSRLLLYQTEDGTTRIEVRLQDETVWMTQAAMAELFQSSKQNVSLHLKNILNEGELDGNRVVKKYLTTAADGKNYRTNFYNLEAIIAVGYRVRSHRGTQFRRWATDRFTPFSSHPFMPTCRGEEKTSRNRQSLSQRDPPFLR